MNYSKIYNDLISKRKAYPLLFSEYIYTEEHHVIPKCLGGNNSRENLVRLTAREHFIAHRLLAKIFTESTGLQKAVFAMANIQSSTRITSRTYQILKENYAASASTTMLIVNSCPKYAKRKSENTKSQWSKGRDKMISSLQKSWDGNKERRLKASQNAKLQMKDPIMVQHSLNNLKSLNGDATWNCAMARNTRLYWGLANLVWELSKYNPTNTRHMFAKEFSDTYDCGSRMQLYQRMHNRFKEGWIPKEDPLWIRDFGHLNY